MKKLALFLALALLMTFVSCGKTEETAAPADGENAEPTLTAGNEEPEAEAEPETVQMVGGWALASSTELTPELTEIFEKGFVAIDMIYKPVACLATQTVAGKNYCFLARGGATYCLAFLYWTFDGSVTLMNVARIGPDGALEGEERVGGWSATEDPAMTEDVTTVFEKAVAGYEGGTFTPVAHLYTQVVAGLNHIYLCRSDAGYALVRVYADLGGGAEITDVVDLDVGSLCTYGA